MKDFSSPIVLIDGNSITLESVQAIAVGAPILVANTVRKRIEKSRKLVKRVAKGAVPIYGVNTGFGFFANKKITPRQIHKLQENLIKSHAAGYGDPLSIPETRLALALRLNVFVKGFSGIRYELCEAINNLINAEIYPLVPEYGSVGGAGDLIPLAHLALPLIGCGEVNYQGRNMTALEALKKAKLKPIRLIEKEGISLLTGTEIMLAVGGLPLAYSHALLKKADQITALTYEAMKASVNSLNPLIQEVRGQLGQIESANQILSELKGSYLFNPKTIRTRVQDPFSLRCAPQIHGASRDAIRFASQTIEIELNAATDNPLVFADHTKILSGGNAHGQSLAFAFDIAALAMFEIGSVSDRRLELLLNPNMSELPAFLISHAGLNSGYMALQYLSASLVSENKLLATPTSTESIPGNVGIEDHVSMGMTSARKLKKIVKNVKVILAIEMLMATQAIDLRKAKPLGIGTQKTYQAVRALVPQLKKDRIMSNDIAKALEAFENI